LNVYNLEKSVFYIKDKGDALVANVEDRIPNYNHTTIQRQCINITETNTIREDTTCLPWFRRRNTLGKEIFEIKVNGCVHITSCCVYILAAFTI